LNQAGDAPEGTLPSRSGFLSSYDHLAESRSDTGKGAWVYVNPAFKLGLFKIAMLDPVTVALEPNATVTAEEKKGLELAAVRLEQEIRSEIANVFPIVTTPGFGVMHIRTAITNYQAGLRDEAGQIEAVGGGSVGVEIEFLDSRTGKQIAAAVDRKRAASIKQVLHDWALLLRDTLDETRGLHRGTELRGTFFR